MDKSASDSSVKASKEGHKIIVQTHRKETYRSLISLAPNVSMNETADPDSAHVINGLHACKRLIQYICSKRFQKREGTGGKKRKHWVSGPKESDLTAHVYQIFD
ncbi:hypothetical protein Y1Q_0016337 [Alligator mississippiensis]|uniref:Uncharacterized protein n=1 Tax=Alligator mississippiensis TaxID=8496 RepID=A0A151N2F1_ALLMI|nr:hypothetical protein Y1Q_0016337 [Alligator mississippiensis]